MRAPAAGDALLTEPFVDYFERVCQTVAAALRAAQEDWLHLVQKEKETENETTNENEIRI